MCCMMVCHQSVLVGGGTDSLGLLVSQVYQVCLVLVSQVWWQMVSKSGRSYLVEVLVLLVAAGLVLVVLLVCSQVRGRRF